MCHRGDVRRDSIRLYVCYVEIVFLFVCFFFFNDTATTEIYTLSLHDALPISEVIVGVLGVGDLEWGHDHRFHAGLDLLDLWAMARWSCIARIRNSGTGNKPGQIAS